MFIYHFTKYLKFKRYIAENNCLLFNSYSKTNDPWESKKIYPDSVFADDDYKKQIGKYNRIQKEINHLRFNYHKVACFSYEKNDIKPYTKSRMWHQYGDSSRGVCIEIDLNKLKENIRVKYPDSVFNFVRYEKGINRQGSQFYKPISVNSFVDFNDAARSFIDSNFDSLFLTKDEDWEGESEFRILIRTDAKQKLLIPIVDCISAIIVGDKFSDHDPLIDRYKKMGKRVKKARWTYQGITLTEYL